MVFGIATLTPSSPVKSSVLELPTPTVPVVVASAFLVNSSPSDAVIPTATSELPTPLPSPSAVPDTPTTAPPTATATPAAPVKTGGAPAPAVNAWSVAVVDEESGALLYGRD